MTAGVEAPVAAEPMHERGHVPRRPAEAVLWNGLGVGGRQLLQFAATIVLARLLAPEQFGLVAMVVVVAAFIATIADLGLGVALVQQRELSRPQVDAAFWLTSATGLLLTLLMWTAAPLIARFYDEPLLVELARAISLQFAMSGIGVVPRALLVRSVRFRALAVIDLVTGIAAAATGIGLALSGAGVWSLAGMLLTAAGVNPVLCMLAARWRPNLRAEPRALAPMAAFARHLVAFRAVNYWARSADDLLVGRFLGAASLGLYGVAYQLIMLPLQQVATVIGDVMLPVLARCSHDPAQVRLAFLRSLQAMALILFPVMSGIIIVAAEAVPVMFGDQWSGAVPVARILALAGGAQALGVTVGWIYQSQGRSDMMFRWGLFAAVVTLIGIVGGLRWGIVGVAAGYTTAVVVLTPLSHVIAGRVIGLRANEVLAEIRPAVMAAGVMVCAAVAVRAGLVALGGAAGLVLGGTVLTGVVTYAAVVALLRPPSLDVLRPAARRLWPVR